MPFYRVPTKYPETSELNVFHRHTCIQQRENTLLHKDKDLSTDKSAFSSYKKTQRERGGGGEGERGEGEHYISDQVSLIYHGPVLITLC